MLATVDRIEFGDMGLSSIIIGSRFGAVVRALAPYQCSLGSIAVRYQMWVEFVVGCRLALRVFPPRSPVFLLHKYQQLLIPIYD